MSGRTLLFVDGSNWYHSLKAARVPEIGSLDFGAISRKLSRSGTWVATRYYVGQVQQSGDTRLYAEQRRFLARLRMSDARISVHLGRLEQRPLRSVAAAELDDWLTLAKGRIDDQDWTVLADLVRRHRFATVFVEKAVDVLLAVDLVVHAERDEFDTAFLLSADGDFTPAVEAVSQRGKRVFAVSASFGGRLARACHGFIRIDRSWLAECGPPT